MTPLPQDGRCSHFLRQFSCFPLLASRMDSFCAHETREANSSLEQILKISLFTSMLATIRFEKFPLLIDITNVHPFQMSTLLMNNTCFLYLWKVTREPLCISLFIRYHIQHYHPEWPPRIPIVRGLEMPSMPPEEAICRSLNWAQHSSRQVYPRQTALVVVVVVVVSRRLKRTQSRSMTINLGETPSWPVRRECENSNSINTNLCKIHPVLQNQAQIGLSIPIPNINLRDIIIPICIPLRLRYYCPERMSCRVRLP